MVVTTWEIAAVVPVFALWGGLELTGPTIPSGGTCWDVREGVDT
jgi:hypothetical protein